MASVRKQHWMAASALAVSSMALSSCAPGIGATGADVVAGQADPISAEEKKTGAEAHPQIVAEFGGAYEGAPATYVKNVGKKIAFQSGLGAGTSAFNVTLLNSSVDNAFAIPGGYIYITRNLTGLANNEAELAGVLGHEVGHVAARHSQKRQSQATQNGIIGIVGQVLGGLLGDSGGIVGTLGGVLQNYSGSIAQLFTLKYSRAQEEQADDLGIAYLSSAGYDPTALASLLRSLAMQTSLDARIAGQDARSIPEWASTHPDPAGRVNRALEVASNYPRTGVLNRDAFMNAVDGMMYDDDPDQGVIEGRSFLYKPAKLKFTVPNGYTMSNGAAAVSISGSGGQAQFSGGTTSSSLSAYISGVYTDILGDQASQVTTGPVQSTTVNGIPAAYSTSTVQTQNGNVQLTVFAYQWSSNTIYHFATLNQAGTNNPFGSLYNSVTRLSTAEANAIRARKLRVVTVSSGKSVASYAAQMAYDNFKDERFRVLNGLSSSDTLSAGQRVKIVTY